MRNRVSVQSCLGSPAEQEESERRIQRERNRQAEASRSSGPLPTGWQQIAGECRVPPVFLDETPQYRGRYYK